MFALLMADIKGTPPSDMTIAGPKTGQERQRAWELAQAHPV